MEPYLTTALSDPKDVHLRNDCDHNHDDSYSHCMINWLIAEVLVMRSNSPVSVYAYCDVDALLA